MTFQERLDEQNIGPMLSDQFLRVIKTMRAAADMISLVAPDDCSHPLFADTSVSHYYYAAQRKYCASCHVFFYGSKV